MNYNCSLVPTSYSFQHQHLEGITAFSYTPESDCYINILLSEASTAVTYAIDQRPYLLKNGANIIYYLQAGTKVEICSEDICNRLTLILVAPESLHFFHTKYQKNLLRFKDGFATKCDARLRLLFEQLAHISQEDKLYDMRKDLILLEILLHQIETLAVESQTEETIVVKSHYEKILLAKQIIDEDLSKNHNIPELAKMVGTNVQYLKKYFKQYYGKTVMNYITEKKMEHAKELILTGDHLVSDVARLTGYKHATHFTTAFKKHFGFIPNSLKYSFLLYQDATVLTELEQIFNNIPL